MRPLRQLVRPPRVAGLALLALLVFQPATAGATFPGENGRIAFASDRTGNFEIYSVHPDGTGLRRLTHTPDGAASVFSDWSPDGRWIVFDSDRTGNVQVFLMRADGTGVRQITHNQGFNGDPTFSPDGRRIVFSHAPADGSSDIWTMNLRGWDWKRVTRTPRRFEFAPQYSPDAGWIAFGTTTRGGGRAAGVALVHPDGTDRHLLTPFRLRAGSADWAPDGSRLVFESNLDAPHSSLYTIRPDGSGLHRLTSPPGEQNDFLASYSPDGEQIVFSSDRGGDQPDIWVMNADGTSKHRLPRTPAAFDFAPDWGSHP
jgi:Tol biopolymer transport system component